MDAIMGSILIILGSNFLGWPGVPEGLDWASSSCTPLAMPQAMLRRSPSPKSD
jgi:hypothetical protein